GPSALADVEPLESRLDRQREAREPWHDQAQWRQQCCDPRCCVLDESHLPVERGRRIGGKLGQVVRIKPSDGHEGWRVVELFNRCLATKRLCPVAKPIDQWPGAPAAE